MAPLAQQCSMAPHVRFPGPSVFRVSDSSDTTITLTLTRILIYIISMSDGAGGELYTAMTNALQMVAPQAGDPTGSLPGLFGAFGVVDASAMDSSAGAQAAGTASAAKLGLFPGENPDATKLKEWLVNVGTCTALPRCVGVLMSTPCGTFSVLRFDVGSAQLLRGRGHPAGIPDGDGVIPGGE